MLLQKKTYRFEDYKIEKINNYYIIKGKGKFTWNTETINIEDVFKDFFKLGKDLYLCIEDIDYFSHIFIKGITRLNIHLLPYIPCAKIKKSKKKNIKLTSINIGDELSPNSNGVIEIQNYDELLTNIEISSLLIDFCKKYGLPYYENLEESIILEANSTLTELSIHIKDILLTSITLFLLNQIKLIINTNSKDDKIDKLTRIMSLPTNSNIDDIRKRYELYLNNFEVYFNQSLSCYKKYPTHVYLLNKGESIVMTPNLVQALSYYYINIIRRNGILNNQLEVCCKCGVLTIEPQAHLCHNCYDKDMNYFQNSMKRELNSIYAYLKDSLLSLNNDVVNNRLRNCNYNTHSPKYSDLKPLIELSREYNII